MKVISFKCGPLLACSYLVLGENSKAVLIDAGGDTDKILKIAEENGAKIGAVLLTHGHFDHTGACADLQKMGIPVYIHESDAELVSTDLGGCGFGFPFAKFKPDYLLSGGEELELCGLKIEVLHTPGHTRGGVCYLIEDCIFSGDTLFLGSYGRVDLGGGSIVELKHSIESVLFALEGDLTVYPGHERPTTLKREKEYNPIRYA